MYTHTYLFKFNNLLSILLYSLLKTGVVSTIDEYFSIRAN